MKDKIVLRKSQLNELCNRLNDPWISDEEKETIRMLLPNCKLSPIDQTFPNPLYALLGMWMLVVLPFGLLWLGIKKLSGYGKDSSI